MPKNKDYVSASKGVHKQTLCNLQSFCNLQEVYTAVKETHPNVNIGFSKFCVFRPKWCVLVGSKMPHSVCICSAHQNNVLLVDAMDWDLTYKNQIKKMFTTLRATTALCISVNPALALQLWKNFWSGTQRTWRWWDIQLLSVGHYGSSNIDNLYSHLRRIQRDFDWYYW